MMSGRSAAFFTLLALIGVGCSGANVDSDAPNEGGSRGAGGLAGSAEPTTGQGGEGGAETPQGGEGGSSGAAGTAAGGAGGTAQAGEGGSGSGSGGSGGGSGGSAMATGGQGGVHPDDNKKRLVVVVGYGAVRIRSLDYGKTWQDRVSGQNEQFGDKHLLLRTVIYAKGIFIAAGEQIYTSPDGKTWTQRAIPSGGPPFVAELVEGNGIILGVGGQGRVMKSSNGTQWSAATPPGGTEHLRSLAFGDGRFVTGGDAGIAWTSTDGAKWTTYPALQTGSVAYCNGAFRRSGDCPKYRGDGPYVRYGGKNLDRSFDKVFYTVQHMDTNTFESMAFGPVQ